jgi:hypothetical protein
MCGRIDPGSCIQWVLGFDLKTRYDRNKKGKERKRKKEEEKEKLQESLQIKGKSIFWEEKNTSTSKIFFTRFSPPSSYHF